MNIEIIMLALEIICVLTVTIVLIVCAWLEIKSGKTDKLQAVHKAIGVVRELAVDTVMELQQTLVEGLKAASADGKLTKEDIAYLNRLLLEKTMKKLAPAAIDLLTAAKVDITEIIKSAGEAVIAKMHSKEDILLVEAEKPE